MTKQKPSFEEAFRQLEEIVRRLEEGNLALEESLALFERGMALARYCEQTLDQAELRITRLTAETEDEQKQARLSED